MVRHTPFKVIACLVMFCHVFLLSAGAAAAGTRNRILLAQEHERGLNIGTPGGPEPEDKASTPDSREIEADVPASGEEQDVLKQIYAEKIHNLQADINSAKGRRNNLLSVAVAAFSIGATVTYAVNTVNESIDAIDSENPEDDAEDPCLEERYDECCEYVGVNEEKEDAQDSLDGIKGIGGGIFLVGLASVAGYVLYTYDIRQTQQKIETLQTETRGALEPRKGLTPDYLRRNESVAAMLEEIDDLRQQAGSSRTKSTVLARIALGAVASGVFLVGVANVSNTVVGNITIDEDDPDEVADKQAALHETDDLETAGGVLLGVGLASGAASYLFERLAQNNEDQIDELENSLLGVVDRISIRPGFDGVTILYSQSF